MREQEESRSGQFGEVLAGLDTQSFMVGEKSYAPGLRIPRHEHETVVISFPLLGSFVESNSFSRYTCERLGLSINPARERGPAWTPRRLRARAGANA
ncbi:MAG TPA: hypothetical protein VE713_13995 [Pyrinomonadaceae bacterium]|nr:hypothetical protein [Pyrinomonadaceae bacterium]